MIPQVARKNPTDAP